MQLVMDILRVVFFPGLVFMVLCGCVLFLLEWRLKAVFYGGEAPRLRSLTGGKAGMEAASLAELAAMILSLAAMGVAGALLVGVKGDLFVPVLLLMGVEVLPLFVVAAAGGEASLGVPLLFQTALRRMFALACVMVSVSLRFPGEFAPGLEALRGEGAFSAVQLWGGRDFAFILASLVCAALALFVFLLGRPACGGTPKEAAGDAPALYHLAAEASQRAVAVLLMAVIFLGYPWQGGVGLLAWSGAALGTALFATAARALIEGRDRATLRRVQGASVLLGVLSVALAFAAVA